MVALYMFKEVDHGRLQLLENRLWREEQEQTLGSVTMDEAKRIHTLRGEVSMLRSAHAASLRGPATFEQLASGWFWKCTNCSQQVTYREPSSQTLAILGRRHDFARWSSCPICFCATFSKENQHALHALEKVGVQQVWQALKDLPALQYVLGATDEV